MQVYDYTKPPLNRGFRRDAHMMFVGRKDCTIILSRRQFRMLYMSRSDDIDLIARNIKLEVIDE